MTNNRPLKLLAQSLTAGPHLMSVSKPSSDEVLGSSMLDLSVVLQQILV